MGLHSLLGSHSEGDPSRVRYGEIWATLGLHKYLNTDSKGPSSLDLGLRGILTRNTVDPRGPHARQLGICTG